MSRPIPTYPRGPRKPPPARKQRFLAFPRVSPEWELGALKALMKPQAGDAVRHRTGAQARPEEMEEVVAGATQAIGERLGVHFRPHLPPDGDYWLVMEFDAADLPAAMAFGVAMLGIYILVVAQFRSFKLPLVVLTPIPLTLIGILLGHWLFHAPFTATSMIGFIALAGIIVRNSILLVDFVRHGGGRGQTLRQVLLNAGAIRFKPILLTALAAMIGAATILSDPIFQGLAISLLFGLASSTLLTVLVIPAIYVVLRDAEQVMGA